MHSSAKRVLVVDDNRAAVDALRDLLELDGYIVVAFYSPGNALDRLRAEHFDAVVTDLEMPHVHGVEIVRAARAARPDMVVIVVTAYGGSPACDAALALGARCVLPKPLAYERLCDELQAALNPGAA